MLSIRANERAALHFEDLASALDAGLPLGVLGDAGAVDERAVHTILRQRGVALTPTEDIVLLAAWRSGRITEALRARAMDRRRRAEFARTLVAGLRYPLLIFVLTLLASIVTAPVVGHHGFTIGITVFAALAAAFTLGARAGLRRGDERWIRMPVIGTIASNLAELPYLETLWSMYGAGVPLLQAHTAAVAAVPVASVQKRLRIADGVLQSGRSLTESLAHAVALQQETRLVLATGEQAGQLEDALRRALDRRRDVAARSVADTARRASAIVYGVAVLTATAIVLTFWTSLYSRIGLR